HVHLHREDRGARGPQGRHPARRFPRRRRTGDLGEHRQGRASAGMEAVGQPRRRAGAHGGVVPGEQGVRPLPGDVSAGPSKRRALLLLWVVKLAFLGAVVAVIARDLDAARFRGALQAAGALPFAACYAVDTLFVLVETIRLQYLADGRYPFGVIMRSRYLGSMIGTLLPGLAATDVVRVFLIDRARPGNKAGVLVLLLGNRL